MSAKSQGAREREHEREREREREQIETLAGVVTGRHEPTGVPHFDQVLGGGLLRGGLVLILGLPGSGKTTLASQIVFNAASAGKTVLILTALSESTTKLIGHLASYRFFDRALIGGPVKFLSVEQELSEGLVAVAAAMFAEVRRVKADYVLLDGFRGLQGIEAESRAARQFLYDVGTTLNALGVTTLVTSETDPRDPRFLPETTTADVVIGLHYSLLGVRQHRGIEVIKTRGAGPMPGLHAFVLDGEGAAVYPQLEERITVEADMSATSAEGMATAARPLLPLERAAFGLPEFDSMLQGGLPRDTCTLLAGSLGTGKTLLALTYTLAGIRAGEPVVYLGFRESQSQLRQVAQPFAMGDELTRALEPDGGLTLLSISPIKINADILADQFLTALDASGARRVVIDSVAEIERAVLRGPDPQRLEDFLVALLQAMRQRDVTALLIKESDKVVAASLELAADVLSVLAENVILLQHMPFRGFLHRIVSVPKLRFSDHDTAIREFRIRSPEGIVVLAPFDTGAGVLEGIALRKEPRSPRAESGPRKGNGNAPTERERS